jgi:tRNA (guanine37-N1)-methyltransferase
LRIDILSLFPAIAEGALAESILGKAQERGLIDLRHHNVRDWAPGKHRTTDDLPYGGGQGMVMKCEPIFGAVEAVLGDAHGLPEPIERSKIENRKSRIVLLSPGGRVFNQRVAEEYAQLSHLVLIAGHYEGVDQRIIDNLIDEELSIGDYVLTNGAIAAAIVVDAVVRLLPGVLGDENSALDDSHTTGLLEFPQYTRPVEFRGWRVPDILMSGHHAQIAKWRREQAEAKTRRVRPDLLPPDPKAEEQ